LGKVKSTILTQLTASTSQSGNSTSPAYLAQLLQLYNDTKSNAVQSFYLHTLAGDISQAYIQAIGNLSKNADPFVDAVNMGQTWMVTGVTMVLTFTIVAPILRLISGLTEQELDPGDAVAASLIGLTEPVIMGVASMLYAQGAMLAIFLPLIPYVIFFGCVLGWLLVVAEALVASPLIAIGFAWPEADPTPIGKAKPGFILLINILLRPSLIIAGFTMALVAVNIAFHLLNLGMSALFFSGSFGMDAAFGYLPLGFAYIGVVLSIATRAFNLIYQVPNKVLSWIGERADHMDSSSDLLADVKRGIEKGTEVVGGVFSASSSSGGAKKKKDNKSDSASIE